MIRRIVLLFLLMAMTGPTAPILSQILAGREGIAQQNSKSIPARGRNRVANPNAPNQIQDAITVRSGKGFVPAVRLPVIARSRPVDARPPVRSLVDPSSACTSPPLRC